MKFVLLIAIMCTLALVHGRGHNQRPCQSNPDNNAYAKFVRQHILQSIPRNPNEWRQFLNARRLCHRKVQSFMEDEESVKQICNGSGNRIDGTNLCMSMSGMMVYDLKVGRGCQIRKQQKTRKRVIVACDKVGNRCRPVHFQKYTNQNPGAEICMP